MLEHVAETYADSTRVGQGAASEFPARLFPGAPQTRTGVNIESLEFPVDGLAQAVISVTTVELTDPDREQLKVEFRRSGSAWQVARADRVGR